MQAIIQNQFFLLIVLIWSLIWKGLALWRAAKRDEKIWYVILLVVNLLGIPEIVYLLVTQKKNKKTDNQTV